MSQYAGSNDRLDSDWNAQRAAPRRTRAIAVHDHGLLTAIGLLRKSMPYALARLGVELAFAFGGILWLIVAVGGTAWLGTHVANVFGWVWFIGWAVGTGFFWSTMLRYLLHLVECGHVAVLTDLIVYGKVNNGNESMFAYGRRVVVARFGQVNALFALNALVRGILGGFHKTLDWFAELLPIPGLDAISGIVNMILRAATRYLDKVVLSYSLASGNRDPWDLTREGIQYYCQNAQPILKTSIYIVILERCLLVVLWVVFLTPAAFVTMILPHGVRETGGIVTIVIALLLTNAARNAFIKPLFLIMMMVRFHALIERQALSPEWDRYLASISEGFRDLGRKVGFGTA